MSGQTYVKTNNNQNNFKKWSVKWKFSLLIEKLQKKKNKVISAVYRNFFLYDIFLEWLNYSKKVICRKAKWIKVNNEKTKKKNLKILKILSLKKLWIFFLSKSIQSTKKEKARKYLIFKLLDFLINFDINGVKLKIRIKNQVLKYLN